MGRLRLRACGSSRRLRVAVAITVASGAAWDLSGVPAASFAPLVLCAIALVGVTVALRASRELS